MKNEIPEYKKVLSHIEEKIKKHELVVGSKLPTERAIAEELGISRNSAREAYIALDSMGIIERVQGSGSYISANYQQTACKIVSVALELGNITEENLVGFRKVLERSVCMELGEKEVSAADIKKMKKLVAAMDTKDIERRLECDLLFHEMLVSLTENPLLITLSKAVDSEYKKGIRAVLEKADEKLLDELMRAHEIIIQSIVAKDRALIIESVEAHFELVKVILNNSKIERPV